MIRKILCPACALDYKPHPEDMADGWKMRQKEITVMRPINLSIRVIAGAHTTVIPVPFLVCDFCNCKLEDGSKAVAVTNWQGEEPEDWEYYYTATEP